MTPFICSEKEEKAVVSLDQFMEFPVRNVGDAKVEPARLTPPSPPLPLHRSQRHSFRRLAKEDEEVDKKLKHLWWFIPPPGGNELCSPPHSSKWEHESRSRSYSAMESTWNSSSRNSIRRTSSIGEGNSIQEEVEGPWSRDMLKCWGSHEQPMTIPTTTDVSTTVLAETTSHTLLPHPLLGFDQQQPSLEKRDETGANATEMLQLVYYRRHHRRRSSASGSSSEEKIKDDDHEAHQGSGGTDGEEEAREEVVDFLLSGTTDMSVPPLATVTPSLETDVKHPTDTPTPDTKSRMEEKQQQMMGEDGEKEEPKKMGKKEKHVMFLCPPVVSSSTPSTSITHDNAMRASCGSSTSGEMHERETSSDEEESSTSEEDAGPTFTEYPMQHCEVWDALLSKVQQARRPRSPSPPHSGAGKACTSIPGLDTDAGVAERSLDDPLLHDREPVRLHSSTSPLAVGTHSAAWNAVPTRLPFSPIHRLACRDREKNPLRRPVRFTRSPSGATQPWCVPLHTMEPTTSSQRAKSPAMDSDAASSTSSFFSSLEEEGGRYQEHGMNFLALGREKVSIEQEETRTNADTDPEKDPSLVDLREREPLGGAGGTIADSEGTTPHSLPAWLTASTSSEQKWAQDDREKTARTEKCATEETQEKRVEEEEEKIHSLKYRFERGDEEEEEEEEPSEMLDTFHEGLLCRTRREDEEDGMNGLRQTIVMEEGESSALRQHHPTTPNPGCLGYSSYVSSDPLTAAIPMDANALPPDEFF